MRVAEELTIRPFSANDEGFVVRVAEEAFTEYSPQAATHTLSMVRQLTSFIAVRGERRVGFMAIDTSRSGLASLQAIAVLREERGRGLGQQLMTAFEDFARSEGALRLQLCTADSNLAALSLFLRCGFHISRRMPRFYARGQNACVLVKDI
jgi:ribosomal protein S18 acetylase RimI-like enzyme